MALTMIPEGMEEVMSDAANGVVNLAIDAAFGTEESGIPKMMIGIVRKTTIANQNRPSNFFIEHSTHLGLNKRYNVEIGDVNDIVTVELLLFVNSNGCSYPAKSSNNFFHFEVSLNVTLSTSLISSDVGKNALNSRERAVTY